MKKNNDLLIKNHNLVTLKYWEIVSNSNNGNAEYKENIKTLSSHLPISCFVFPHSPLGLRHSCKQHYNCGG